jgi:hypothetical protein
MKQTLYIAKKIYIIILWLLINENLTTPFDVFFYM